MANLTWAIERKVQGADGRAVDRFEACPEKLRAQQAPEATPEARAAVAHHLASTVPDHWIPARAGAHRR